MRDKRPGPDTRTGPVPVDAVLGLLSLLRSQGVPSSEDLWLHALVSPARCAEFMRAFKLDVSLDLHPDATPRFSVNDTGEPEAFRRRVSSAHHRLGLETPWLTDFWALSAAGDGQTTLSIKWEASGMRVGLYFEELHQHSDAHGCRKRLCDFIGVPCPPVREGVLGAICVDIVGGAPMGYKEYYMVDLNQAMTLPEGLRDYADRLSSHPLTGKKRALHATRHDLAGAPCGHKMLWMTEATRPELATWAWNAVLSLQHDLGLPSGDNLRRMRRIVQGWRWSESCYVYPDLVSLNTDTEGRAERLLVYTSVK